VDDPLIGKVISKYELVEHVGRGATADVYKAYQPTLDRYVALKLLHRFLADQADFLERFQREAKAIARLHHVNIVQVYDFDLFADIYYLAMEYVEGVTLKTRLQELSAARQVMPLNEAVRIARCVAQALSYAHGRDMHHRDIKPANIMIDRDGRIVLTDFGLAKILGAGQHTASGVTVGTPAYASPEQVLAQPTDARSDIYALGVVLFHMVTGKLPYEAETGVAMFLKHLTDPLPSPRQFNPDVPPGIETIIRQAMAKRPEDRYQTADALVEDLNRLEADLPIMGMAPSPLATASVDLAEVVAAVRTSTHSTKVDAGLFRLPPYVLSPGNAVDDPAHLPAVCDADWDRAVTQFMRGYIVNWMREGVTRLRASHQHGLADDLETIAERAEGIIRRAAPDDIAQHAALEEFLESLGAAPPVLGVEPQRLDLPALGVEEVGPPVTLTLTNTGRGYLSGQISSQAPWLIVEPERFGCAAGQSTRISLAPDVRGLAAGRLESDEAIVIRSARGEERLPAELEVLPAVMQLDGLEVDFGAVGQGEPARASLSFSNAGRGFLVGRVLSFAPWLSPAHETFSVPAGHSVTIPIEADSRSLESGAIALNEALAVASNAGQVTLGVRLQVEPPRLVLEPEQIDLGSLDLAQPGASATAEFRVRNRGLGVLVGVLKADVEWLHPAPASFRCRHGETQPIQLSTGQLKTGEHYRSVRVLSNAREAQLHVRLRVFFSLEPETILIPAGEFLRGSVEGEREAAASERPQRRIYLADYHIGKYPVTNAQYAAFVAAAKRRSPAHWVDGKPPAGLEQHPVVYVSWNDAAAYCAWLGEITGKPYRLPSEAQWEKAARGIDGRLFPWGNYWEKERCNTLESRLKQPTPVGAYSPAGDSPFGCADTSGNVWEWVADWYTEDYYALSTTNENPMGPAKGAVKGMRGGSFSADRRHARAANRSFGNRSTTSPEIGFRCAIVPPPS
jgi:serine/threonine-protein kinase